MSVRTRNFTMVTRGIGALGDDSSDGGAVVFASDAVVAPQFSDNQPGTYDIGVVVEAVPIASSKLPYIDVNEWTQYVRAQGVDADVLKIAYRGSTDPRSTGGPLDVFDAGTMISDNHYTLTVRFNAPAGSGMSGLGSPSAGAVYLAIGLTIVAAFLYYKITGQNVVVEFVKYVGAAVAAAVSAIIKPLAEDALGLVVPVLIIGGLVLFALKKSGSKVRTKWFSTG